MQDDNPTFPTPPRRRKSAGRRLLALLLAVLIGAAVVTYFAWRGDLDRYLPQRAINAQQGATDGATSRVANGVDASRSPVGGRAPMDVMGSLETRLAMLEERFSRIDFEADAASGNAARAEGLLIAFAARRLVERGEPLGFVADQLQLRFADAQPNAVETIITFARAPVTVDELGARLEALTPDLTDNSQNLNFWQRTRQEVVSLFRVRSDSPTLLAPQARIDRARLMLSARRIRTAIDEVERLPGAEAANKWIADAQRFQEAQRALDLIETTAMLEPRRLKDGSGQPVEQPSPLSTPSAVPTPETPPQPTPVPIPAAAPTATPTPQATR
jgi:hypothetical protein